MDVDIAWFLQLWAFCIDAAKDRLPADAGKLEIRHDCSGGPSLKATTRPARQLPVGSGRCHRSGTAAHAVDAGEHLRYKVPYV